MSIIEAFLNPNIAFIRNAFFAGLLSSVLFGILGSVITVRRIASLAGAISHAVLGGIGMALYLQATLIPRFPPILGALIFAVLSGIIIGVVSLKAEQRKDTVINAIWPIGMSLGILFMAKTPGYIDPSAYLFGNILLISSQDLILMLTLGIIVLILAWRFYPQIEACAFDEEFALVRGVPVRIFFLAILIVTSVAIVLLQRFVGIIMLIAMFTLPAGTAGSFARNLSGMMILSSVLSVLFFISGIILSWYLDLPVGAVTVIIAGTVFLGIQAVRFLLAKR